MAIKKRSPGGGRPRLDGTHPTEEVAERTVKIEVLVTESQKVGLQYLAALRSTQLLREVTVSELIRNAIPLILNGEPAQ